MQAERFRKKAQVYMRLRCCLLTHVKIGKPPAEVPNAIAVAIAEELLVEANAAAQKAERMLATAVNDGGDAARTRASGCARKRRLAPKR